MNNPSAPLLALFALSSLAPAITLVNLDFETPGQYAENFRLIGGAATVTQASHGGRAAVGILGTAAGTTAGALYDTSPTDSSSKTTFSVSQDSPITISADLRVLSTRTFGFYIFDGTNESAPGYLALLGVGDTLAAEESMRFATNVLATGITSGTLVHGSNSPVNANMATSSYYPISLTYSINASNEPVFNLTANGFSSEFTGTGLTALTNIQIGWRASSTTSASSSSHIAFDNFQVSQVPEPSSLALLALGLATGFRRSRAV